MTKEQTTAIGEFFAAAERLKSLGIIRSDRYLGDIAEFLCVSKLGMSAAVSGTEPGHDGHIGGLRSQVKFNGGSSKTIQCGNPSEYDELIVVLGPRSVMRPSGTGESYLIYRIPSEIVAAKPPHADGMRRMVKGWLLPEFLVAPEGDGS